MTVEFELDGQEFIEMTSDPDPARSERFMEALMKMKKIHLAILEKAYRKTKAA